jgi:hypothetical protein
MFPVAQVTNGIIQLLWDTKKRTRIQIIERWVWEQKDTNNIRDVKINWWHFLRRCLCHGRSGAIKVSETGRSSLDGSSKLIGVPVR